MSHLKQFLKAHSIDDIKAPVEGELNEYATNEATFFFGNGELIVSPADDSQDDTVYVVDNVRGFDELIEY